MDTLIDVNETSDVMCDIHTQGVSEYPGIIINTDGISPFKAYNLVQMFQLMTEAFEVYIKRRLLSMAHNRFDSYISSKYKGLLEDKIDNPLLLS